jgi:YVTN family beta-propeller protein
MKLYSWILISLVFLTSMLATAKAAPPPQKGGLPPGFKLKWGGESKMIDQLPEGPGKNIVLTRCTLCHGLERVVPFSRPKKQWADVINAMIVQRGMPLTPDETTTVIDYMAKNFGPAATYPPDPGCAAQIGPSAANGPAIPFRGTYSVWVANLHGGGLDIIDPATNKIAYTIKCLTSPEGLAFSPDGRRAYVTDRVDFSLNVIDTRTGGILKKVPLTDRPNWDVITPDGKKVFINSWPLTPDGLTHGHIYVFDTTSLEVVRTIPTESGMHDSWMAPDGKYFVSGSAIGNFVNTYDVGTEKLIWSIKLDGAATTMTWEHRPDGSNGRIFQGITYPGFAVIDFSKHEIVKKVRFPVPASFHDYTHEGFHGIEESPDGKTVWFSGMGVANPPESMPEYNYVYAYSLPDLKYKGSVHMSDLDAAGKKLPGLFADARWLCVSPDSKRVYVTSKAHQVLSVIDAETMKEVARIPVHGEDPEHVEIGPVVK